MKKKIGVLGSGAVAQTLGNGFIKHGCEVMLGTRDARKLIEWKSKTEGKGNVGSFSDAAKFGDIIVLAAKGKHAQDVLKLAGEENLKGKTVVDTTNPIEDAPPQNGVLKFFTSLDESLMERLQKQFPDANLVKAFNSIGGPFMVNPDFGGEKPSMFICGNKEQAKMEVREVLEVFGFDVEDMGSVESARAIEPLCMLWCISGFIRNQWTHAFKLIKK